MTVRNETIVTNGSSHSTELDTKEIPKILESLQNEELEPIAVVGLSLRFPQDAVSEESFWEMLVEKRCASTEFPKDRMNIDAFYNSDQNTMNSISTRGAHFLGEDIRAFDAPFFSIPPLEASTMDPQQRGLLETTYRALENAGIPMESVKGSDTSVHVGSFTTDFETMYFRDAQQIPRYTATGTAKSILSNRISWFFDFVGPSMTIDTACSSSMVALDSSCNGLWSGESSMGIVAGANLIFSPELNIALSNMSFLSPDSRCFSFDDRANGYARGEGFGVLVLKRLSRAIADGDTIRALIRSTGVNQDGHTAGGVTQPNKVSQARLISETYRKANLDMNLTRFFEAHGTGTAIGDPIEAGAIGESFQRGGSNGESLYIGAVKSNIGHLEGASGIAGIIKTIKILEKGIIPPNSNFEHLNSQIDDEFFNLKFPRESISWPSPGLRRASVNSFGFGGTNAHAVLDDAFHYLQARNLRGNHYTVETPPGMSNGTHYVNGVKQSEDSPALNGHHSTPRLLILSAADEKGLARIASSYSDHFSSRDKPLNSDLLDNLAYTLDSRRSSLPWKSFVVADSTAVLKDLAVNIAKPIQSPTVRPNLGFIFTGQGAQWHAMGRELVIYPEFLESLVRSEDCLEGLGCPWSLTDELAKNLKQTRVNEPEFSQPLCTAIQIALVDLLRTLKILPATVVGHSSGEIAAAYCTGSLSRASAIKLAYYRGLLASGLMATTKSNYRMAAVGLSRDGILEYFEKIAEQESFDAQSMTVSCINSPKSVTISGPKSQIDILVSYLEKCKVFARKLMVNVGYHSPQMLDIADEYYRCIGFLVPDEEMTGTTMISSVTSKIISSDVLCTPAYWVQNLVSPVNFNGAMKNCCERVISTKVMKKLDRSHLKDISIDSWVEVGPHSALQGPFRDILTSLKKVSQASYSSVLIRNRSAIETLLAVVGRLHCEGFTVDIQRANQQDLDLFRPPVVMKDLPEYPFNHSVTYWEESRINKGFRFRKHANHTLLGSPGLDWNPLEPKWRLVVRLDEMPWLEDHKVNGSILYPAAAMLAMAIEAMKQLAEDQSFGGFEVTDAVFHTAVVVPTGKEGIEMQICLRPTSEAGNRSTWYEFRLFVYKFDEEWEEVCRGSVRPEYGRSRSDVDDGKEEQELLERIVRNHNSASISCVPNVEPTKMYRIFKDMGLEYGPAFQSLSDIHWNHEGESISKIALSEWSRGSPGSLDPGKCHVIHPSTLDGVFQLTFVALSQGGSVKMPTTVPSRIDKLWVSSSGIGTPLSGIVRAYTEAHQFTQRSARCFMSVLSESEDKPLLRIDGLEVTAISSSQNDVTLDRPKYLGYHMEWKPDLDALTHNQLLEYCQNGHEVGIEPIEWYRNMDFLALAFGNTALAELKRQNKTPIPSMQKYASWIRARLVADIQKAPEPDRASRKEQLSDPKYLSQISEKMMHSSRGSLYVRIGNELPKLLTGELDPLPLLFDEPKVLGDFYEELNEDSSAFKLFSRYLSALIHKDPGMKMLEVGAGTGATTKILHETLAANSESPRYEKYDFTDISPSFFSNAQRIFEKHKRIGFRTLDIEKDPSDQGFEDGGYDVVIAANVLHATKSLKDTIRNVRKMLRSGGRLVLAEITVPEAPRNGFLFGLLQGWWLSSEDYRLQSPCISEEKWDEVLKENGFSGTDTVFQDFQTPECHGWSIMASTAIDNSHTPHDPRPSPIIIAEETPRQEQLIRELNTKLELDGRPVSSVTTLDQAAELEDHSKNHYILLNDLEQPLLPRLQPSQLKALQVIFASAGSVLWVTGGGGQSIENPEYGSVQGLCRVSRREHFNVKLVTLALEDARGMCSEQQASNIAKTFNLMSSQTEGVNLEPEYIEIEEILHINRVSPADDLNQHIFERTTAPRRTSKFGEGPPIKMSVKTPGLVDSIEFIKDPAPGLPLRRGEIEVEVHAIGVNFKDLLTVLGRVDTDKLGCECSGVIRRVGDACGEFVPGDRVALCGSDFYRTYARSNFQCAAKIPDGMSFAEAAALPTAFGTAYYCLCEVARMQPGESILIHAASGGTGQAAVQLALHLGAEIYATVGSKNKKQLLMDTYGLSEDHIFYSRDTSFADGIRRMTNGQGVDVVLNSLSGEGLIASWECIAPYGRFLEIGRKDIDSHGLLPMYPFIKNASFTGVDLAAIVEQRPAMIQRMLGQIMLLVADGKLHPAYPLNVYSISNTEQALRTLQSGKSSGKIVLDIQKTALVPTSLRSELSYTFDSEASYVVAGGLGGIGRSIARWLVDNGARYLLLLSRSGIERNVEGQQLIADLRSRGVRVETPACDIAKLDSLMGILKTFSEVMPPIKGCFQAAMTLRDTTFGAMSHEDWQESTNPKVEGSWNLHTALPKGMDFFIMLSSACGIFGNVGQSNYAAGNTYQDALAQYRIAHGEKATALDLGVVLSDGFVAENPLILEHLLRLGIMLPIGTDELHALFDYYCDPTRTYSAPIEGQVVTGLDLPSNIRARGGEVPYALRQPLFRYMHQIDSSGQTVSNTSEQTQDYKTLFAAARSLADAGLLVSEALKKKLSRVLGIPQDGIELNHRVESYGVDSLVAVELRNWLAKEMSADVAVFEILGGATLIGVGATVAAKSSFRQTEWVE